MKRTKRTFSNTVDIIRLLAAGHGHLWATADNEDERVAGLEELISATENYDLARAACRELSNVALELVSDMPAPHNYGIEFPEDLAHKTATGREYWVVVNDRHVLYMIFRPFGMVLCIGIYEDGTLDVEYEVPEQIEERHLFTVVDALLSLGFNPEDMPEIITKEIWESFVRNFLGIE